MPASIPLVPETKHHKNSDYGVILDPGNDDDSDDQLSAFFAHAGMRKKMMV